MELKRLPPCLPAVLQPRGYGLNLREKDDARDYTAMVHSQDRGIQSILDVYFSRTLVGCLRPPEIVFSSTWKACSL